MKGQQTPSLEIDALFFQGTIERFAQHRFGSLMQNYKPPKEKDTFESFFQDNPEETQTSEATDDSSAEADRLQEIYRAWTDLHPITQKNVLKFEKYGYRIPEKASGDENVRDLVGTANSGQAVD